MKINEFKLRRFFGTEIQYEWKDDSSVVIWNSIKNYIINVDIRDREVINIIVENTHGKYVLRDNRSLSELNNEKIKNEIRSIREMYKCKDVILPWIVVGCFSI
ncbi:MULTISPECIES: hypothetical protein [unclassified Tatumella]|uniref:hypothetical protein n=1 Tax=unclassified Tatumella TaxID=2649542 RepID=UPI001BAEB7B8|nr:MULTISPECIES: hypothetical protein [unclassified Tatumella]MBS0876517.1 hypothetical protein [Tatumella sp. JGM82]MBS0889690.1 hypothetical protein [Tatumella sp. JGM94]MBS0900812.1 hypothetical protein [Tatumella sp. JGM100]